MCIVSHNFFISNILHLNNNWIPRSEATYGLLVSVKSGFSKKGDKFRIVYVPWLTSLWVEGGSSVRYIK